MTIDGTGISRPTQPIRAAAVVAGKTQDAALDYSAFLKLLIAQMQNQDPMEPMKSSDYVAQLATFSQVEKSVETNTRIAELLAAVQLQQAASLVGQSITTADGTTSGVVATTQVLAGRVVAVLTDGREVTIEPGIVIGGPRP
jgi:flagellar basal-body rod modification protein FlgD